jgi:SHS family lactate transporter-like MFS transporter
LALALLMIPLWAFGWNVGILALGAFLIQMGVQGAWGIIPAHLVEVSPDATRGLVPGLAYQLGILMAAPTNSIEYALRDAVGYRWAIASFEIVTIVLLGIVVWLGREERGKVFTKTVTASEVEAR